MYTKVYYQEVKALNVACTYSDPVSIKEYILRETLAL